MRLFAACFALLLLTSCIPVEDWGGYWDKGTTPKGMAGHWREVSRGGAKHDEGPQAVVSVEKKGVYRIDSLDPKDHADKDYTPVFAKSLKVGAYTFLMTSTGAGEKSDRNLVRYVLKGSSLTEYRLNDEAMAALLRAKHPFARNIDAPACKGKCLLPSVKIKVFDGEVFRILSDIPDTPKYWAVADQWRKMR